VPVIIERARALKVDPLIGVRIRTSTKVDGHWAGDSGDQSIFGVSSGGLMKVIDTLKDADMLHCLQLLHCHIGSQIPNIRNIRMGVMEACRYYTGLLEAGAPMGYLDLGGGLAVDYEGTRTNSTHSMNYQLDEYCVNVVETVIDSLRSSGAAHPVLITESGRATVSYASVLLFNILDVRDHRPSPLPDNLQDTLSFKADSDAPDALKNLWWVAQNLSLDNFQESYNDAIYYRDALREDFLRGQVGLPIRALADNIALEVFDKVAAICAKVERVPEELKHLPELLSDTYYGNFSLFQSLPDMWAIDQILPVMPVHRLTEAPTRNAVIADITCDCDGKIDHFSINGSIQKTLPMHEFDHESDYHLGVFLVGAYQETLGDLHNLFGDTNVVSISVKADGTFEFAKEMHGDSISDVLSYVEYDPKALAEQFRRRAEKAVKNGTISAIERREIMSAFYESLDGYTYYEQD
jgi:arginine decarboxylase